MEIQNNLNKAKELDEKFRSFLYSPKEGTSFQQCLLEMAEWKDEQFAEEKKQWIEKAADYIYTHSHVTTFGDIRLDKCSMTQFVKDFKKAMEE